MKKIFQKQREIIIIFAYIVAVTMLVYFVVLPLLSKIEEANNQIQEESMKQEIIKQQLGELPKIQQQYDALQENEGSVDILLDKDNAVTLIEKLETLADNCGDKIEISVQNSQLQKNIVVATIKTSTEDTLINALPSTDYLQMQIVLTGNYNEAIDFIRKLESMEYYSDITGIKIKQNEQTIDVGVANPFSSNSTTDVQKISDKSNLENIETTLNVVFYTKK